MQVVKEKLNNLASSAKEHVNVYRAIVEEKVVDLCVCCLPNNYARFRETNE